MSIQCPRCALLNPYDASRCDCGWVVGADASADDTALRSGSRQRWAWLALLLCAALIVLSEGLQPLVLWNLAPLGLAAAATAFWLEHESSMLRRCATSFVVGALMPIGAFHLMWMFDIAGTRTGSSTAALALLVVPLYAVTIGGLAAAVAAFASWLGTMR